MSDSLLQLVNGALTEQTKQQIGMLLGASEEKTSSAIRIALPAILGGIVKKASAPQGAAHVYRALDGYDSGSLNYVGVMLGGGDHAVLLNSGSAILAMAWGSELDSRFVALAKAVGMDRSTAANLSRVLSPIIMAVLGGQRRLQGLDVSGLKALLVSQQSNLVSEIPDELAHQLAIADDTANVQTQAPSASPTVSEPPAAEPSRSAPSDTGESGPSGGGGTGLKVLLPLLIIVGLFWLAWQIWPNENNHIDDSIDATLDQSAMAFVSAATINEQLDQTLGELTSSIKTVRDIDTAKAVLPQLAAANKQLEGLGGAIKSLPEEGRAAVRMATGSTVQKLQQALESVYGYPGVRDLIEPAASPLVDKLSALAR